MSWRRAVNDQASSSRATMMDASLGARIEIKRGKRYPVEVRYRHRLTGWAPIGSQPFLSLLAVLLTKPAQELRLVVEVQRQPRAPRFLKV
jgi:hypothetical protein